MRRFHSLRGVAVGGLSGDGAGAGSGGCGVVAEEVEGAEFCGHVSCELGPDSYDARCLQLTAMRVNS